MLGEQLKLLLEKQATSVFGQLGYTPAEARDAKREGWWWLQARLHAVKRRRVSLLRASVVAWTAPGEADLVSREVVGPSPGEVTVELRATAVSAGTERAQFLRLPNTEARFPVVPGYSGAGVVLDEGGRTRSDRRGQRVLVVGAPHASVTTASAAQVVLLPNDLPFTAAATGYLGVIALEGVEAGDVRAGTRVAVLGTGMIGVLSARIAASRGAQVVLFGRSARRESVAHGVPRVEYACVADAATHGQLAEVVIDATGDPEAIDPAVELAEADARIVLLGSPRGQTSALPIERIRARRLEIVGAHGEALRRRHPEGAEAAVARHAAHFLELLARRQVVVDDLLEVVDPRHAGLFYRSLARPTALPGAVFDWNRLPAHERIRRSSVVALPRLRARGIEPSLARGKPTRKKAPAATASRRVPEKTFGFAIVGCGDIGAVNAAAVSAASGARLVACYDPIPRLAEDVARAHGASPVRSLEEALERPDVEAVFVCVPHDRHAPVALDAIAAGRHVVVEKPLSADYGAAVEVVLAAERAGVALSTCFPHRYDPAVESARELVDAGALGQVAGATASFFTDKSPAYWYGGYSGRSFSNWRTSRAQAGGGVLITDFCHFLDLVRYISGLEAEAVTAVQGVVDDYVGDVEQSVSLVIRYHGDAVGGFVASSGARGMHGAIDLRLWGPDGTIILEPVPQVFSLVGTHDRKAMRWTNLARPQRDLRATFVERFVDAMRTGSAPEVSGRDGLAVQAIIEAAYRSTTTGTAVRADTLLAAASMAAEPELARRP